MLKNVVLFPFIPEQYYDKTNSDHIAIIHTVPDIENPDKKNFP